MPISHIPISPFQQLSSHQLMADPVSLLLSATLIVTQGKCSPSIPGLRPTSPAEGPWATWPGEAPSALSGSSSSRNRWEPQQHQINQAGENNTAKALKIKLSLEPQPTKVGQHLHAKLKQDNCLLLKKNQIEPKVF